MSFNHFRRSIFCEEERIEDIKLNCQEIGGLINIELEKRGGEEYVQS
jgi:hypothetical protein